MSLILDAFDDVRCGLADRENVLLTARGILRRRGGLRHDGRKLRTASVLPPPQQVLSCRGVASGNPNCTFGAGDTKGVPTGVLLCLVRELWAGGEVGWIRPSFC
mmetsp:Transcript_15377/g.23938  ORF Transcript_15377/g.23938 Transcript_15377/m.23938 type:complete len:104 (+) Transcript_15377:311-622(+)